jgi:hypothetical protein
VLIPRSPRLSRSNLPRWHSDWCGQRSAYAIDWLLTPQGAPIETLSAEALHLAMMLAELLPDEPEVLGLAALVCLSEARRAARRVDGRFVPLDEQDRQRWDGALIARGEDFLRRAHHQRRPGRMPACGPWTPSTIPLRSASKPHGAPALTC